MAEQMTREEAIRYLTMQQDLMADTMDDAKKVLNVLEQTGDRIGYAPAFRCLVKGLTPEDSIHWGNELWKAVRIVSYMIMEGVQF